MDIGDIRTQDEAVQLLEGWAEARRTELGSAVTTRPLVKTYMLEHSEKHLGPSLGRAFAKSGITLTPLRDGDFETIWDSRQQKYVGFLERLINRHPVIYTTEKSDVMDPWVKRLVHRNPSLDRLWISGMTFHRLWSAVLAQSSPNRFGRIVFQHDNLFENAMDLPFSADADESEPEANISMEPTDDEEVPERKATRFAVVDRLSTLERILPAMRSLYGPLRAISQLRFPGARGGGHDFYYNGKVTNRTDSFSEHRLRVRYVLQVYSATTLRAEAATWSGVEKMNVGNTEATKWILGAPVRIQFSQALTPAVFDRFVESVFVRKNRDFNLWGNPIRLGPTKVHVYALDRHVAQQLFIEITNTNILVVIPAATCGNSIHRLVTNVQQFLDPAIDVWIGDQSYESLVNVDIGINALN